MTQTIATPITSSVMLLTEANHRFCNSLQMILSSTSVMLGRGVSDTATRQDLLALQDRVILLAGINRSLCGPFQPDMISESGLSLLCRAIAKAFGADDATIQIVVSGSMECAATTRALVLLIAELMTNALKHCSRERPLRVRATVQTADAPVRLVFDSNTSAGGRSPALRMANEIADEMDGSVQIDELSDAFRVTVTLPVTQRAISPAVENRDIRAKEGQTCL